VRGVGFEADQNIRTSVGRTSSLASLKSEPGFPGFKDDHDDMFFNPGNLIIPEIPVQTKNGFIRKKYMSKHHHIGANHVRSEDQGISGKDISESADREKMHTCYSDTLVPGPPAD